MKKFLTITLLLICASVFSEAAPKGYAQDSVEGQVLIEAESEKMLGMLESDAVNEKVNAIEQLGEMKEEAAVEKLIDLLSEDDSYLEDGFLVSIKVREALMKITGMDFSETDDWKKWYKGKQQLDQVWFMVSLSGGRQCESDGGGDPDVLGILEQHDIEVFDSIIIGHPVCDACGCEEYNFSQYALIDIKDLEKAEGIVFERPDEGFGPAGPGVSIESTYDQEEKNLAKIEMSKDSQEALEVQSILGAIPAYKIETSWAPEPNTCMDCMSTYHADYYDDAKKLIGSKDENSGGIAGIFHVLWTDSKGVVVVDKEL